MSRKQSTLWNFLFLNVGFLLSIVNGILIIPLYLHYMNSGIYGAWLATGNILTWITMVDPGVSGVLLQKVSSATGRNDKTEIGLAITSGIFISLSLFAVALALGIGFSFFVVDIARIDKIYSNDILSAFRIAVWGSVFYLISHTFSSIILAFQKAKYVGIINNAVTLLQIIVTVTLLVRGYGIYSLAVAALIRGVFIFVSMAAVALYILRQNHIKFNYQLSYLKSFSKIFTYTFGSRLFDVIASNIDLILVSRYLGSSSVTILDLCRRPLKILTGLSNNITISMLPSLAHLYGSKDEVRLR